MVFERSEHETVNFDYPCKKECEIFLNREMIKVVLANIEAW